MLFDAYFKAKFTLAFTGGIILRTANSPWSTDERRRCVAKWEFNAHTSIRERKQTVIRAKNSCIWLFQAKKRRKEKLKNNALPQEPPTFAAPTQTLGHVRSIPPLHLGPILRHTVHIIKRQLLPGSNLPDGKQRKVVNVFVRMVAHARKDAQVGLARVVDEARRPGEELAVHL